jgi:thiamine-monophosphate kinase
MADDPRLGELGEWNLINRLAAFAPAGQFADDAAVLQLAGELVVNTDVLVEGVHFSDATTDGFAAGWRAAAANLSDLAAMGCRSACGLTVGLVAPASTRWSWVEGVYQGLQACLQPHGGVLLGGDCSSGPQRLLAITALGPLLGGAAIHRGDGRPGDALVCTGPHGLSRLGLALLQNTVPALERSSLPAALTATAIEAHRCPRPRFDAVEALHRSQPAGLPWRIGGTDSSDGLAAAVAAIARSSSCRARLERAALPLDPAMAALPQAEAWCLGGGEDFELVLALEPRWALALMAALPGSRVIGRLEPNSDDQPLLSWQEDGSPVSGSAAAGWSHFH